MTGNAVELYEESGISGKMKVAVLCMTLGSEASAEIAQFLSPDEVEGISFEIARIDHVDGTTADGVLAEWEEMGRAARSLASGGVQYAREILEKAFGEKKADSILNRIEAQLLESDHLVELKRADPQQLTAILRNEHPQTVALILAHLDHSQAAAVLQEIGSEIGSEVLYRMARMEKVSPELLDIVGAFFGNENDLYMSGGMHMAGGPEAVAQVLNQVPSSQERDLLATLSERDPELCDRIKNLMFVFEDLVGVEDRSLQRLMQEVETNELALSLKAASDEVKGRIEGVLTKRALQGLREEIEFLGPVRVSDVEAAQQRVVALARSLEESGEILLTQADDDQVIE